ncbi:MAG TPA: hypothetical protein VHZ07_13105 [Bryobacteraceae bacterium]|jgi:branched-subunit amino acid transport protein AzlD|nr:hypothetical protein [Bryobacteraceae bacterium]
MIVNALTSFHVALSLIGIGSGVVAIYGLLKAKTPGRWTRVFLATTAATSITGFLFPFHGVTPAQVLGVLSLIALIIASLSIYRYHSKGIWRRTYGITAVMALYFNVFVLVVQLFRRVPALSVMAPTQSEPPFQVAQLAVLLLFAAIGIRAAGAKPRHGLVP